MRTLLIQAWAVLVLCACVAEAPADPGPQVASFSPGAGDYGATVTVEGKNLGGDDRDTSTLIFEQRAEGITEEYWAKHRGFRTWNEDRLEFRYPFPYEGKVFLETAHGTVELGEFQPSWSPGAGSPPFELMAAARAGPGKVAAIVSDGDAGFVVRYEGDRTVTQPLPGRGPESAALWTDEHGEPEGVLAAGGEVWHLTWSDGPKLAPTGHATTHPVAGGRDEAGVYAWIFTGGGWTLARPDGGTWSGGPPVEAPTPSSAASSAGTLFATWTERSSSVMRAMVGVLTPGAKTMLVRAVRSGESVGQVAVTTAPSGRYALVASCATGGGFSIGPFPIFDDRTTCRPVRVDVDGGAVSVEGPYNIAYSWVLLAPRDDGRAAILIGSGQGLTLGRMDMNGVIEDGRELPLWPMSEFYFVLGAGDALELLVRAENDRWYLPRPR